MLITGKVVPPRRHRRFRPILLWLVLILTHAFVFSIFPIAASFYLSFFDYALVQNRTFVGLDNYVYAITRDTVFHKSLVNTIYFTFISVPLGLLLSLLIAQLIHTSPRFKAFFRTAYFLPVITPLIATAIVWRFILQSSTFGLLNSILVALGLPPQPWLTSTHLVVPSLIIIAIWSNMGYNIVLFQAGLVGIPTEFYDAAKIDGANAWQLFWKITWPMLAPTVLLVTVTGSIGALQVFNLPFVMTRGGPADASRMTVMWIQEVGFAQFRMGYATTLAYLFFGITFILAVAQLRYLRVKWSY